MANISKVYLLHTPLEDDMKNTLYFSSETAQHNYFVGTIGKTYVDVSYQSDTRTFRCPDQIDTVRQYGYMMWQNPAYSNKWFYGFIKKMTYVSDGYTDVVFEVDPIQTFMFNITVKPSFIDREHTNDDTVGNNLIPEGLEHGEYKNNGDPIKIGGNNYYVLNADKAPYGRDTSTYTAVNVGGVPMSGELFVFTNMPTFNNAVQSYASMEGGLDHIKSAYVASFLTINGDDIEYGDFDIDENAYYKYKGRSTPVTGTTTLSAPTTIDNYTPRNKKLLSGPYQYLLLSNNNGATNMLNYEYFADRANITIETKGVPTVGGSITVYPKNYKGTTNNYNEGVIGGKLPTLSWSGDAYTNWLTQNAVNIGANVATSAISIGAGALSGLLTGGVGAVIGIGTAVSGINAVTNQLVELYEHSIVPNTFSGNTNGGDVNTANKTNAIYVWKMSITAQFARVLDDYFDMYGYATHRVKTPNVAHRQNWWYTKTINANIIGDVPNDYLNQIKEAYNNGITFWRNASNFLNYSVSNGIV